MTPHYTNTNNPIDFPKSENNMNERIQQLAEQAKKYALDAMIKITDKEQALKVYSESYDTKFAELIVQECAKIADKAEPYRASDLIKKHFGVEL
jgi:hypothetical protein